MSAIEMPRFPILIPADFTYLDEKTLLVHQGAVLVRPEPENDRGRVIGYATLCIDVLTPTWPTKPSPALPNDTVVSCFDCIGAHEQ
jgi:hypothetical protein